ncbi:chromosome partitioning protein ParB [Pseudomonas sp. B2M1-30]|uniref:Chromosome partitioning protein ParB n=1 Tax=Pseudomonas koreensis TaxID=198620 RepID=A0A9X3B2F9_9PSED|nr:MULTISPECIES: ParB-like protein [Pseudomonas]MCU0120921.1 chromosome partitioning protein ParB [Pseudomonas sp. B2M1-30]MCU7248176.1 chromosome partitioning protein ParB [Pseudomonas koreensis]MCU7259890.1 chromosome partitioning protein ParB [Pseudomonas koreensis]
MPRPRPQLIRGKLEKLHPTQLTVGLAEVADKRQEWKQLKRKERAAALDNHWFPCVLGAEGVYYIVDHHHFGLALLEEEVKRVSLLVLKDLSFVDPVTFWNVMNFNQWAHPYDSRGVRRTFEAIPRSIVDLQDDPYRSLAGQLRRAGGYAKDATPYSEFLWADFLRSRIASDQIINQGAKLQAKGMALVRSQEARYLPGWVGSIAD